ncbi:type II secretion system F family protein [Haloglomus halophilum]|uniref:type II secretion system F family protein n=1 Tax=Haloglomus halophilum TaxID=2962672 RepID=UPI0020CA1FA3|nr:type II secretion system F family protein [Haloglomus halophilum]
MSSPNVDDTPIVPEYELEQYFPERSELSEEERAKLREQHGYFRTYFREQPDRFRKLQRWLNQARFGVTYDVYLASTARYTIGAAVVGLVLGVVLSAQLMAMGAFAPITELPAVGGVLAPVLGPLIAFVFGLLGIAVFGGGTAMARYYYPRTVVNQRQRNIDVLLPHAIVYMYALSHGGMNTFEVIKEVAQAEDVYGEVARECDMIVRDVELFGNDLFTAIRDARNLTPSDNFEQFLDDTLSVLDSGSDFSTFLSDESETYMNEAKQEQENFLETLSILSEIFVVMFVAAPLFLIVTLMVISLLGGDSLAQTQALVYLFLPAGMVVFIVLIDLLSKPYAQHEHDVELSQEQDVDPSDAAESDPHFEEYEKRKRRDELLELVRNPISEIRKRNPLLSLAVSVPAALLAVGLLVVSGQLQTSLAGMGRTPIKHTVGYAVIPFLVTTVPLTLFYEAERRREQRISSRFPDTLNILSSANQMGIRLVDALDLVSRWSEGTLADELRKVRNDITWNHDIEGALLSFADRLRVPQVTRTMKLIAKGSRSSSDLSEIISIAAEDTRNRYQIEQNRRQEMSAYTAIVAIGFLVYLAVIVLLDTSYLQPIGQMATDAQGNTDLLTVSTVPVDQYRTIFFHSALIQGAGSGLLAGKLAENDILAGLKYSIVLVAIALAVFIFL